MQLNHPIVESVVMPLTLTLALTGSLAWMLRKRTYPALAAAAIGIAVLVVHGLIFGPPSWPARSGMQKLPLILALALIGGIGIDMLKPGRIAVATMTTAAVAMIAVWLGWPQLSGGDTEVMLSLALTSLLALACLDGLVRASPIGTNRPAMLILAALGLAGASINAGSLALFQIALALAAALGGFSLWNWPRPRLPFAASGLAVGALGCLGVALLLLLLTQIQPWMLLPLPLIFGSDAVARRLPVPMGLARAAVEPVYVVAIGCIPMVATILLADIPASADDLYYR